MPIDQGIGGWHLPVARHQEVRDSTADSASALERESRRLDFLRHEAGKDRVPVAIMSGPNVILSDSSRWPVTLLGQTFPSVESAVQAVRAYSHGLINVAVDCATEANGKKAKLRVDNCLVGFANPVISNAPWLGRGRAIELRYEFQLAKFEQHPLAAEALLHTSNGYLLCAGVDRFWDAAPPHVIAGYGACERNWTYVDSTVGEIPWDNWAGHTLMRVRHTLQERSGEPVVYPKDYHQNPFAWHDYEDYDLPERFRKSDAPPNGVLSLQQPLTPADRASLVDVLRRLAPTTCVDYTRAPFDMVNPWQLDPTVDEAEMEVRRFQHLEGPRPRWDR